MITAFAPARSAFLAIRTICTRAIFVLITFFVLCFLITIASATLADAGTSDRPTHPEHSMASSPPRCPLIRAQQSLVRIKQPEPAPRAAPSEPASHHHHLYRLFFYNYDDALLSPDEVQLHYKVNADPVRTVRMISVPNSEKGLSEAVGGGGSGSGGGSSGGAASQFPPTTSYSLLHDPHVTDAHRNGLGVFVHDNMELEHGDQVHFFTTYSVGGHSCQTPVLQAEIPAASREEEAKEVAGGGSAAAPVSPPTETAAPSSAPSGGLSANPSADVPHPQWPPVSQDQIPWAAQIHAQQQQQQQQALLRLESEVQARAHALAHAEHVIAQQRQRLATQTAQINELARQVHAWQQHWHELQQQQVQQAIQERDVCTKVHVQQQLSHVTGTEHVYGLSFVVTESPPDLRVEYVDLHYQIDGDEPIHVRLGSSMSETSTTRVELLGMELMPGSSMQYYWTYRVHESDCQSTMMVAQAPAQVAGAAARTPSESSNPGMRTQ